MTKSKNGDGGSAIKKRLISLVETMSEEQLRNLVCFLDDKRKYPRKAYIMTVDYQVGGRQFQDFILDISMGGTFIETHEPFPEGEKISLRFSFRGLQDLFLVDGAIVWQSKLGIGVMFDDMTGKQKDVLQAFINSI